MARPRLLPACRGLFGRGVTVWAAATSPVGAVPACCRTPPSSGTHAHPVGSLQAGWGLISTPGTLEWWGGAQEECDDSDVPGQGGEGLE